MMNDQDSQRTCEDQATAELVSSEAFLNPRRVLILYSTGLLMLVAWMIFSAWEHPQSRTSGLLQALLILLVAVHARVSKERRGSLASRFSKPGTRRTLAALLPLLVLALFGWSQVMEARHREAERQLALKREAWKQAVERQRNVAELAVKRSSDSVEKYTEAFKSLGKAWEQVKTADGQTFSRPHRDAMQRLNQAHDEARRALELRRAEEERLRQLESQRPDR
jgi:hypothetical protein